MSKKKSKQRRRTSSQPSRKASKRGSTAAAKRAGGNRSRAKPAADLSTVPDPSDGGPLTTTKSRHTHENIQRTESPRGHSPRPLRERVLKKQPRPRARSAPNPELPPARRRQIPKRRRGLARTAYRYMMTETLRVMLLSVFVISLIGSIVLAYQLARSGVRLTFLWPVLLKSLAYPLFFSLPVSFLFGITLGLGRLTRDLEITAMRANGLSYFQLSLPIILLGVALSGGSLYLNGVVIPEIHYEKGNLRDAILAQLGDLGSGRNRSLLLPRGGHLFVESYQGTRLKGVHLEVNDSISARLSKSLRKRMRAAESEEWHSGARRGDRSGRRHLTFGVNRRPTLLAKDCDLEVSADRSQIVLHLRGVKVHLPQLVTDTGRQADVFRQTLSIGNLKLALPFLPKGERVKDHSWEELFGRYSKVSAQIDEVESEIGKYGRGTAPPTRATSQTLKALRDELTLLERKHADAGTEIHRRSAFSFASLSFALVGLPLIFLTGARSRLVPFFISNVFIVTPFFLLVMLGITLGEQGIPPVITLLVPNLVLLGAAAFLWPKVIRK